MCLILKSVLGHILILKVADQVNATSISYKYVVDVKKMSLMVFRYQMLTENLCVYSNTL